MCFRKFWARNKPGDVLEDFFGMGPGQYEQGMNERIVPTFSLLASPLFSFSH